MTHLVIHGHFYQPPRENPWTGMIEREPSAAPSRDWNERVHYESYRPNGWARIVDGFQRVVRIVNNYEWLSFNVGPTLMAWLERTQPQTYQRILDADRRSARARGGHGNAIAQAYGHAILPLCNARDRLTQVRWGLRDFELRFGRRSESLWLPETAANEATLSVLVDEGLRYVLLAPTQAEQVRPLTVSDAPWTTVPDAGLDTRVPYRWFHPDGSGRSIDVFFYDGNLARAMAFDGALGSSEALIDRMVRAGGGRDGLVNVALDGETFGHHFHYGERGLAYALSVLAQRRGLEVTNYGHYLDRAHPTHEVRLKPGPNGEGTSWSCAHGVGRWIRDCGCNTGARDGWNQAWRGPLRAGFDLLRDHAAEVFETQGATLLRDPWAARDAYVDVVLGSAGAREAFFEIHAARTLDAEETTRALTLLELQRHAMLTYTSCGWFFADVSGIETVQCMRYAGRVLDLLAAVDAPTKRDELLDALTEARSNLPEQGTGADVFRRTVDPARINSDRVAAHLGIASLAGDGELPAHGEVARHAYRLHDLRRATHGRLRLTVARVELEHQDTLRQHVYALAALYFGGIDFYAVLRPLDDVERFVRSAEKLWSAFPRASLPTVLRIAEEEFGPDEYGLENVLPDMRDRISAAVFGDVTSRLAEQYAHIYEDNRRALEQLDALGFELPAGLRSAAEFTLGRTFEREIREAQESRDAGAYRRAIGIAQICAARGLKIDRTFADEVFGQMLTDATQLAVRTPTREQQEAVASLVELCRKLGVSAYVERAQEIVYDALTDGRVVTPPLRAVADALGLAPEAETAVLPERTSDPSRRPFARTPFLP